MYVCVYAHASMSECQRAAENVFVAKIVFLTKTLSFIHFNFKTDWSFPDAGELPVPVLSVERLSFAYPGGVELYSNVDFGVDLQTRVALVGPNGAGTNIQS